MLTAIIIDDESDALELLALTLKDHFSSEIKILGQSTLFDEAFLLVKEFQPDVLFLDIDLGGGRSGFDVVEQLKVLRNPPKVVFTTAFQQFAIKAVRVQAYDYLLKPVSTLDIKNLLERLAEESDHGSAAVRKGAGLVINTTDALYKLDLADIIYFQGNGNYTDVHVKDRPKPILSTVTLNQYEAEVGMVSNGFFRTHKSFLVNLAEVNHIKKSALAREVVLKNGVHVKLSRLRAKEFMEAFLA